MSARTDSCSLANIFPVLPKPVITVLKSDEFVAPRIFQSPILICDSKRDFDSGRAVVGIKNARQRIWLEKIDNRFGQLDRRRVGEAEEGSVGHACELRADRSVNVRMIVAVDICPNG